MHILAIDQGTTGTTALIFDKKTNVVKKSYRAFKQIYPQPGWVEHDPMDIWQTVLDTTAELLSGFTEPITALGITNQRETTIIWDKTTGLPIHNAIVWQCRRTATICNGFRDYQHLIHEKTGLPLDAYFSATKIKWLLENIPHLNIRNLLFGTVDTWLVWMMTKGNNHVTDYTNASRTLLYNIKSHQWDDELLKLFNIPPSLLPEVKNSADNFGTIESLPGLNGTPILGIAGDQQAALFGQRCFSRGQAKNTYGTGCFILMNTGKEPVFSSHGLVTTPAIDGDCKPCYALEGSIFIAGAVIQWLRDELNILENAGESESIALSVSDNGGVYFVPAFVGLGTPHWNPDARGTIVGLTRGTKRAHIIRAALEAMAYQTYDVMTLMEQEAGIKIKSLAVDGGATANDFLMQFQSNILNRPIIRPEMVEITAFGAALLAGHQSGKWKLADESITHKQKEKHFSALMDEQTRQELISGWQKALRQTQTE